MDPPPADIFWIVWIVAAYLVGAIPFGVLIARMHGVDIRSVGSGNTGATNVGRTLGPFWGIACFFLDAGKGAAPVLVSGAVMGVLGSVPTASSTLASTAWLLVGFAAILGHVFSPFLRLRGGKGVATAFGALVAMWPLMTLPTIVGGIVFFIARKATGYMSLASIIAAWSIPLSVLVIASLASEGTISGAVPPFIAGLAIGCLVTVRHRSNIARIRAGTEPKAGVRDTIQGSQDAGGTESSKTSTTPSVRP